ncbi:hypothetical protein YS40_168 [Thermus phage phiYS40]|uniref:hypothetical protein n=1 Tax=Thermus phage phiYS40 TaxID=407392 RepID=UPI0000E68A1E|nr:hypothetical protein YS40_168 [Thermus phage phiYS40]ABJ91562.1 hypothetical protein YS40_168 [Thermus phage phiYS40]BAK53686.1 hypothetical protein YSP_168 [Thermus phage phiYS40]
MPKEYEHCKESYLKKGVSEKKAKAICAGMYYNRHGITVNEAKKRGLKSMKLLYLGRTKEALKSLILANGEELKDFVIVKVPDSLRKNEVVKSIYPKVENEEYVYVAVHKSVVDVTVEGKVVLSLEKLLSKVEENETSKQNEDNVAHVEAGKEVVKEGKLEKSSGESGQTGSLKEEIREEVVVTKSKHSVEEDDSNVPFLDDVIEKLKRKNILTKEERAALVNALRVIEEFMQDKLTDEQKTNLSTAISDVDMALSEESNKSEDKSEDKALEATSATVEALEKEDLESEVVPVTKSLSEHEKFLSLKSIDGTNPVFESKHDANRYARLYNLHNEDKKAVVLPASMNDKRKYGTKAKYVVVFE